MGQVFSIRQFRLALWQSERFLAQVDPGRIFHRFKGVPSDQEYQRLAAVARRNIRLGREYLQLKLLAMALLEALAEITGGDAPLCLFTGTMEDQSEEPLRLENFLPPRERVSAHPLPEDVIRLLDSGRPGESTFDIRHSPLSLFLFRSWGSQRVHDLQEDVQAFFNGKMRAQEFLDKLDGTIVAVVAEACAAMVPTRREALLAYAHSRSA
jgi:hypothetical protein